jgi:hypothetical protein
MEEIQKIMGNLKRKGKNTCIAEGGKLPWGRGEYGLCTDINRPCDLV